MHTRNCTGTHTNHTLFHARTRAHTTRGRLLAKPAARAPALLTPQPKCARARLKGRHTPAGAGSAILQGPYLLPARMHRPHPPITGAAECPLPAPAFDHGDQQPIPGTGTCSLTRDLGQPGFQWLPQQSHILAASVWQCVLLTMARRCTAQPVDPRARGTGKGRAFICVYGRHRSTQ